MEFALKHDEMIRLYLKVFIPIPEICNKIIDIKNNKEFEETLEYHIDKWESIAGEHYFTRDTHYGKFSYIFDNSKYIVKRDHRIYFYQMTGIPYQIVELIHELIRILNEKSYDEDFEDMLLPEDKKRWLRNDDALYSELSKRIMIEMRK